jgi:uncharacterized protein
LEADGLINYIRNLGPKVAVAYSGGVDSSVVAGAAFLALSDGAVAVTVSSELVPESEVKAAEAVARAIGIRHIVVAVTALDNEMVASNPPDRCYHCKGDDFSAIRDAVSGFGIDVILDGTNADDPQGHRPGLRALAEMGVISPLKEMGLTKADVRRLALSIKLPNHDKPSAPCLASRFPYGMRITREGIFRVLAAEDFIRSLGVGVLRVRDHGAIARIEVEPAQIPRLASDGIREKIVAKLHSLGYNYVSLDLEGFRSGSLDEGLGPL